MARPVDSKMNLPAVRLVWTGDVGKVRYYNQTCGHQLNDSHRVTLTSAKLKYCFGISGLLLS